MNSMRWPALFGVLLFLAIADPRVARADDDLPPIPDQNPVMDTEVGDRRAQTARPRHPGAQRPGWYFWGSDRDWRYRENARLHHEREKRWRKRVKQAEKREREALKHRKKRKKYKGKYADRGHENDDRYERAPHREHRGPEHDRGARYSIVFDSERGVRIVIEHPGLYFEAGRYYRFQDGGWQVGLDGVTGWRFTEKGVVPLKIRVAYDVWYYGTNH